MKIQTAFINCSTFNYQNMIKLSFMGTLLILCLGCGKEETNFLTVKGRIVDVNNNQVVSNFPVQINYINPSPGMGFNLGSWSDISNSKTDMNGNFTVTTPYAMAKDTDDFYVIESFGSDNYFGFSETIDARQAESQKNINLGDIKVDKIITLNLTIHHLGVNNSEDFILGGVNKFSFLEHGSDSVIQKTYQLPYNKACIINLSLIHI